MQLLKVGVGFQDGAQHDTDYDSQGSETEHSEGDPEKQVHFILVMFKFISQCTK